MAKHKAATEVTIAPIGERSALAVFLERYWKGLAIAFAILAAAILYQTFQTETQKRVVDAGWNDFVRVVQVTPSQFGSPQASFSATPEELIRLSETHRGQPSAPWFLAMAALAHAKADQFEAAAQVAGRLRAEYPGHATTTWDLLGDEGSRKAGAALLEERAKGLAAWKAERANLFQNPALPEGSPRVLLETSAGPIELGLYADRAPKHVENFLKLVDEGFYQGTKFHRVVRGFMVQGGDPNSRELDTATWGTGGPGYKIDAEISDLLHFRGALAAAKMGMDVQSSGSQFYITTGSPHHLDGQHTVFGTVLNGWAAVDAIESGEVVTNTDRPRAPVEILSAKRL